MAPVGSAAQFTGAEFTEDDLLYAKTAEDFVRSEVLPRLDEIESKQGGVMPALLRRAGELGLLMGRELSLEDIEHGILRKEFQEPRIHFRHRVRLEELPRAAIRGVPTRRPRAAAR